MKRFALSLLLLAVAVPTFARVISYAPYTSRVAIPSFQERTSRHFVLIESKTEEFEQGMPNDLVLYDATGAEEPRLIGDPGTVYEQAALYQRGNGVPLILAIARQPGNSPNSWMFPPNVMMSEGGASWQLVGGLGSQFGIVGPTDFDTGGPFTHGLTAPIQIGNDAWPFIVSLSNGVWAVGRNGTSKLLFQSPARAIGRNAAGDQFLVYSAGAIWTVKLDGSNARIATVDPAGSYSGWITPRGTVYFQMLRNDGRYLFYADGSAQQFIAGAYNQVPPPRGSAVPYPPAFVQLRFFAVPTHDYSGAWMIQREAGKPTTLSRHTASGGLQTMWTDVTGPQVEALITGASGQSVLIQVHREREGAELNQPFIDPALAVWRVGEPAPREYDELYLNENLNKGFVHIHVDEIASGKPFVFNSGFMQQPVPVSRVSPPIAGGGDVIQEWGVVRASLKQRLVIPGVARLSGAFASFWMTDLTMYNPLEEPQNVEVRFSSLGSPASATRTTTVTLNALEIRAIPDALKTLFDIEQGGGTLHFLPAVGINATARTYSRKGEGTFGFGMQAIDYFNAAGPRFPISFAGAFPGEHFRTNMLLTDTSGRGTRARLQAFGVSGLQGPGEVSLDAPAEGTMQYNALAPAVGLSSERASAGLVVEPTHGTAIVTVVAIDNRTNDPTYFPPDLPASITRVIPVIGHLDGANGSKFRSDLYLYNPGALIRTVTLAAKKWDTPELKTINFTLLPKESRVIPDALKTLFGMEGLARLRYATADWMPGDGVRVTSRTYTVEPSGATYGCLVPPLNSFQIGTPGDRLEILGISGGAGFRTNIGLVDLSDTSVRPARVRVSVIDNTRRTVDSFTVDVPARGGMQINDIFGARGLTPPPAAMVTIDILDGQQIGAYATLTDNVTNDSTFLAAHLGAKPN